MNAHNDRRTTIQTGSVTFLRLLALTKRLASRLLLGSDALELDGTDFYDPVKGRRVNWGWAKVAYGPWNDKDSWASSAHTLPRCAS